MAEPGPQHAAAAAAVAELAADLREWLVWAEETGAIALPLPERPVAVAARPEPPRVVPGRPGPGAMRPPLAAAPTSAPPGPRASGPPATVGPAWPQAPAAAADQPPPRGPVGPAAPRVALPTRAPARSAGSAGETLAGIRADLGDCRRCPLHQGRRNIVYGVGHPDAELMLVGEAPGQQEDITGEPFVGRSGQLLTRMLNAIGLERGDVYIANVLKCRPPGNRDPEPNEIACCSPFVQRQIQAVRPRVILTLGRFAAHNLVGLEGSLGELRRQVRSFEQTPVVTSYHPSYLLRTPRAKRQAWEDLLKVRALLRGE